MELKPAAAVLLGQQRRSNKAVTRNTVGTIRFALANHIFRRKPLRSHRCYFQQRSQGRLDKHIKLADLQRVQYWRPQICKQWSRPAGHRTTNGAATLTNLSQLSHSFARSDRVSDQACRYHATFIPSYRGAARLGQRRSRDGLGLPGLIVSSWEQTFGGSWYAWAERASTPLARLQRCMKPSWNTTFRAEP